MTQTVVFVHRGWVTPACSIARARRGSTLPWLIAQDGWEEVAQACIDWMVAGARVGSG